MGHRITRSELAHALHGLLVAFDSRHADFVGLVPRAREAVSRCKAEGLVPRSLREEQEADDALFRQLETAISVVHGGIAHLWKECPCPHCVDLRDFWNHALRERREAARG